jgi:excisionase family DNA binding protein
MGLKSVKNAADAWGVSVHTVRRLACAGVIRTVTVGRRRLISEVEIGRVVASGVPSVSKPDKIPRRATKLVAHRKGREGERS